HRVVRQIREIRLEYAPTMKEGRTMPRRLTGLGLLLLLSLTVFGSTAQTADGTLTNNNGTASTLWFISGEPSLVINGFDLNARNITLPIQVESITISVRTPTPGIPV